jgi:hypothetical protein
MTERRCVRPGRVSVSYSVTTASSRSSLAARRLRPMAATIPATAREQDDHG